MIKELQCLFVSATFRDKRVQLTSEAPGGVGNAPSDSARVRRGCVGTSAGALPLGGRVYINCVSLRNDYLEGEITR